MEKPFKRIITVMFENQYHNYVMQNQFMKKLASAGANMTNYFGAFHPSQTNYLASLAGEICGVTNDTPPATPLMQETLVDLLEEKKVSWKAYMEAYPGDPWNAAWEKPNYDASEQPMTQYPPEGAKDLSRYYRKHNAFASYHTIQKDKNRWEKIVSDVEFWNDVSNDSLPEYSWFTPDIWNDGHYLYNTHIDTNPRMQLIPQLSAWLEHVFLGDIETSKIEGGAATGLQKLGLNLDIDLLLTNPKQAWKNSNVPEGTLIVVTFDEADYNADGYDTNYDGPNQIYTVLLGDMITPGTTIDTPYNHYNLIRTVEKNYGLGSLYKNDYEANWFRFLWNEKFSWKTAIDTDFEVGEALAISQICDEKLMVFSDKKGRLFNSKFKDNGWTTPASMGITVNGTVALATMDDCCKLIFKNDNHELWSMNYNSKENSWELPTALGITTAGSFSLLAYNDMADEQQKLMLCWVDALGFIQSLQGNMNGFSKKMVPVKQMTDGPMVLGQLGASLFLVYKERNTRKMRITSFNVGSFNAFEAVDFKGNPAPENNTTLHQWAVTDYTVGHFSKKMAALGNEYQCLGQLTMDTIDGEMHLIHRGGYADTPEAYTALFGLTGVYSAANQLTNGYGTLNQAGWTKEIIKDSVSLNQNSPIALSSNKKELTLVWADANTNTIHMQMGGYHHIVTQTVPKGKAVAAV